jgi:hypothetical protein
LTASGSHSYKSSLPPVASIAPNAIMKRQL